MGRRADLRRKPAVVGAYLEDTAGGIAAGGARVFRRTGTTWVEEATLLASDGAGSDYFGWSVALSGDGTRAFVGAVLDDTPGAPDSGSARAFLRTGTSWVEEATLSDSSGRRDGEFGTCVVLSTDGSRALVSSHLEDTVDGVDAGTARVFARAGTSWAEEATLLGSPGGASDYFSYSLAMSADGSVVLSSSFGDDTAVGTDAGSVSVFVLPTP